MPEKERVFTAKEIAKLWRTKDAGFGSPVLSGSGPYSKNPVGEILLMFGVTPEELIRFKLSQAEAETARLIRVPHVLVKLLWQVNIDKVTPVTTERLSQVLVQPESYFGPTAPLLLAFGQLLDSYTPEVWDSITRQISGKKPEKINKFFLEPLPTPAEAKIQYIFKEVAKNIFQEIKPEDNSDLIGQAAAGAVWEIQASPKASGYKPKLLPLFLDSSGEPLTLNWLKAHPFG